MIEVITMTVLLHNLTRYDIKDVLIDDKKKY